VGDVTPHEEQQKLILEGLGCDPVRPFWEFVMPSRTVAEVDSCMCIVLASTFSWYSNLETTRFAIYSNASETPSPVFADVKNNFGLRSGFGSLREMFKICVESVWSCCWDIEGKGLELVRTLRKAKLLGVIVGVDEEEEEEEEALRLTKFPEMGDNGILGGGEGERETGVGDDLADS